MMDRKCFGGNMGIKLDITKASDTLSWDFLLTVLRKFGFHDQFVNWISLILNSARLSVLINGVAYGFFNCGRGVRQGDPLSPLLFCLAEEVLSRGITHLRQIGAILPISAPRRCHPISHVLYADDVFIFCRGDQKSLRALNDFLEDYGEASGQRINRDKCVFFLGKTATSRLAGIKAILGFENGTLPFTYLGVPIFKGCPKRQHLQSLADRACAVLSGWQGRILSLAGRLELLKSVFQSLFLHSFKVYLWPRSLIKMLHTCARNFVLSGCIHKKKIGLISWNLFCSPKQEGGLGLRRLDTLNSACLLKSLWDIRTGNSESAVYLQTRYFSDDGKKRFLCSSIWSGLRSVLDVFVRGVAWVIGDGKNINFWHDKWLDAPILPRSDAFRFQTKISDVISQGLWCLPDEFYHVFPHLKDSIHQVSLPCEIRSDRLVWTTSRDGMLSLKDSYNSFRNLRDVVPWHGLLWKDFIPPKFSMIVWRVLHGRVPVDDVLRSRGVCIASACFLC